jgi:dGTPase
MHNEQSVRVVEVLEKGGKGLNLTWEVRDGILHHPQKDKQLPATLEGQIVRYSDHIAYIRHDIEDSLLAGIIKEKDLPKRHTDVLGKNILDTIIPNMIEKSKGKNRIQMDKRIEDAMNGLYDFLYEKVYTSSTAKGEEKKIPYLLTQLFKYYHENPEKLPLYKSSWKEVDIVQNIIDFIAGMTDRYATNKFTEIFVPNEWHSKTNN